jgi:hypothetical protein
MIDRARLAEVIKAAAGSCTHALEICLDCLTDAVLALVWPEIHKLRRLSEERAAELLEQREQAERPKCLYCDYGRRELITVDLLQWHIRKECVVHPLYQAEIERDRLREQVEAARLGGISARSVIAGQASDIKHLREQVRVLRMHLITMQEMMMDCHFCGRDLEKGAHTSDCPLWVALAQTEAQP